MTATTANRALAGDRRISPGVMAATVAGNALEFYDFLCFAFFAVYIAGAFFPGGDPFADLLKTLAVFWSGFLFRPLGGIVIGAFADRVGRRPAMLLTIALITVGTLGLALVPSYATIGATAPVLLVICRIIQGFALGGEVGPASVFLMEAAPPHRRGYYVSWQIASQGLAVMAGGGIGGGAGCSVDQGAARRLGAGGFRSCSPSCSSRSPPTCARTCRRLSLGANRRPLRSRA